MKKVYPTQILNNSLSNIQSIEDIKSQQASPCRVCNKSCSSSSLEQQYVYPCPCPLPIHKKCLFSQMNGHEKTHKKPQNDKRQQRYNCKKCSEVIRFRTKKELRCRTREERQEFIKSNCCMCFSLSILMFLIISILSFIIYTKIQSIFKDAVLQQATLTGLFIALGILTLIAGYFLIFEVLLKTSYKIKLLERKSSMKNNKRIIQPIQIINYQ